MVGMFYIDNWNGNNIERGVFENILISILI